MLSDTVVLLKVYSPFKNSQLISTRRVTGIYGEEKAQNLLSETGVGSKYTAAATETLSKVRATLDITIFFVTYYQPSTAFQ